MRGKKLVKVELTYWTYLTLPGDGSGSPDHSLPVEDEDMTPGWGIEEGRPGHLPSRPSREEILETLKEYEDQIRAKIDEIRDAVADRIPGIREKLEAIKAEVAAKIDEIKNRPVDPDYGLEEGGAAPGQGLPDRVAGLKEAVVVKLEQIKQEIGDQIPGIKEKIDALKVRLEELKQELIDRLTGGDCARRIAEIKAEVRAKIDRLKEELANRGPDIAAKIEQVKAALVAKIESIKAGVDPGYGIDEGGIAQPKRRRFRR